MSDYLHPDGEIVATPILANPDGWSRANGQAHVLNIEGRWYGRLRDGSKTCDVRRHDRDYQVGDILRFRITDEDEEPGLAPGVWIITHVLPFAHVPGFPGAAGWCVLSLRRDVNVDA